jgi:hypothetical protein
MHVRRLLKRIASHQTHALRHLAPTTRPTAHSPQRAAKAWGSVYPGSTLQNIVVPHSGRWCPS